MLRYHAQYVNWFSNFYYVQKITHFPSLKIYNCDRKSYNCTCGRKCEQTQPNTLMAFTLFKFTLHNCRLQMQLLIECKCATDVFNLLVRSQLFHTQKRSVDDDLCLIYCLFLLLQHVHYWSGASSTILYCNPNAAD